MASKSVQELQKFFGSFSKDLDDEGQQAFIHDTDQIMLFPARKLIARMGLDQSTSPFALLDHACGIGPLAAELQDQVDRKVLEESRILCSDVNANLVDILKLRAASKGWANIETAALDAQVCPLAACPTMDKTSDMSFLHRTLGSQMRRSRMLPSTLPCI